MIDAAKHPLEDHFSYCTGCAACAAVCPVGAVSMTADSEGFSHPQIDLKRCTGCNLCRRVCPIKNPLPSMPAKTEQNEFPKVLAAWHIDPALRKASSSGGVFSALAESILAREGVVAGVTLDQELTACHILIEKPEDIKLLQGSKYVQSRLTPSLYHQIRGYLLKSRPVCFAGTPCQVAGLRAYLQKDYPNLYCCDLACHGVPSPLFFQIYLDYLQKKHGKIQSFSFRDKQQGWENFQTAYRLETRAVRRFDRFTDPYMAAFLLDYTLRPACYACQFANLKRHGDITLGDFWGVRHKYPQYDLDDRGTSLLLINNEHGETWLATCRSKLWLGTADLQTAVNNNLCLKSPVRYPPQRALFYQDLQKLSFKDLIKRYRLHPSLAQLPATRKLRESAARPLRCLKSFIKAMVKKNAD